MVKLEVTEKSWVRLLALDTRWNVINLIEQNFFNLVEERVERLPVNLGLELLLSLRFRDEVDFHVRVRHAADVHGRKVGGL